MAQLWKYITELSTTDESYEDSDQIVINQGGRSVQIPWSILKAGIENRLNSIDGLLDNAVFTGSDEEEGYLEADITIDNLKQDIININETLINIKSALEQINTAISNLNTNYNNLSYTVKEQGNDIDKIKDRLNALPTISHGDVDPNTILEDLSPKENDIYIYTGDIVE